MVSIEALLATLAGSRKVFHSEADFQHALAWQIHDSLVKTRFEEVPAL